MGAVSEGDAVQRDRVAPEEFSRAVRALTTARLRPEIELSSTPAPGRLAPYSYALAASVPAHGAMRLPGMADPQDDDPGELAGGRLVLLHAPDGHEAWHGTFRLVTMARAELEPEMAADPLLAEVGWSWLIDSLRARGAEFTEPSGTISRCASHYFGGLADRPTSTEIELRASWTPHGDLGRHLAAWGDLLCACAGLPPSTGGEQRPAGAETEGVSEVLTLPRRGDRR